MSSKRNASPSNFGFEFQICAAIYLLFNNIRDIKHIKVEGQKEDIEITYVNNKKDMMQVKSVVDMYSTENVSSKLKDSLITLGEADGKNIQRLTYISNYNNPLNTPTKEFFDYDVTRLKYNELSLQSKSKVDKQIKNIQKEEDYTLSLDKLEIMKIPFFGEDKKQKRKYIIKEIESSLTNIDPSLISFSSKIIEHYISDFLDNASGEEFQPINKSDVCLFLISLVMESISDEKLMEKISMTEDEFDEACTSKDKIILNATADYENLNKVYSLFIRENNNRGLSVKDFINKNKLEVYNIFFQKSCYSLDDLNENETKDMLLSQIMCAVILLKKEKIKLIKGGVGL